MSDTYMMDVNDVAEELRVSTTKAYQIMKELNASLEKEGYYAIAGKVPRPYFKTKFYGFPSEL